jgi:pyridoxal phosphate enzyme (YggS family)
VVPVLTPGAIAVNLAAVERRIAVACARSGRVREEVQLVAVSKGQSAEAVAAAHALGHRRFGENRVQEAVAKVRLLPAGLEWHLLGPLQSNKVRPALGAFAVLHAMDRPEILDAVEREAERQNRVVDVFLEINVGGENSKHGFGADDLALFEKSIRLARRARVVGLMAIPPFAELAESSRPWFRILRGLRDRLREAVGAERFPGWLSMGMSADFEVAIEEGATHVRVGTAIFGERV